MSRIRLCAEDLSVVQMLFNSGPLLAVIIIDMVALLMYNFSGMCVTGECAPTCHTCALEKLNSAEPHFAPAYILTVCCTKASFLTAARNKGNSTPELLATDSGMQRHRCQDSVRAKVVACQCVKSYIPKSAA